MTVFASYAPGAGDAFLPARAISGLYSVPKPYRGAVLFMSELWS